MKFIKLMFYKWVLRTCPHLCKKCVHYNYCWKQQTIDDLIEDMKIYLFIG